jgi:nucleoside-diphosphate-sugar epimerase
MDETVLLTGATGRIGPRVLERLAEAGYRTLGVSRSAPERRVADRYLRADCTDAGETYGALAAADPDAVVHFGTISTPDGTPGHVTYESNVMTTYNVLEAAAALDVGTVVLASSLSAMGAGFEPAPVDVRYLPVDEAHPLSPSNPYGLGKQVAEVTADGVARRADGPTTVASLRFPWVTSDADAQGTFVEADRSLAGIRESGVFHKARNTLFAYLHVDDAAEAVRRAVAAEFAGHEAVFLAAPDTTTEAESADVAATVYPDAEVRTPLSGRESLLSTAKAQELLGWEPERSWR